MSARVIGRVAALGLLAAVLLSTGAGAAQAAGFANFSARPGTFNPSDPVTRAYFKPHVAAGGEYGSSVVVTNPSAAPVRLLAYPVDGLTAVTSGAVYANAGVERKGAGRWLRLAQSTLVVPPHSQRRVAFSLQVPAGTWPGDHLAGIALQEVNPQHSKGRFSITEVFRVVVGVEIIVPGPASAAAHVSRLGIAALPGTRLASVVVGLGNAGGLLCKPTLTVTLRGARGAKTVVRRLDTLLGGDTIPYPLAWPTSLRSGLYRATAAVTGCGHAARLTANVRNGTALSGASPFPAVPVRMVVKHTGPGPMIIAALAALLLGLLGGVGLSRFRGRRVSALPTASADEDDSALEVAGIGR